MKAKHKTQQTAAEPSPVTTTEIVTPEIARRYLEANYANRAVRGAWVDELAGVILRGQWRETHQGIAFDLNGRLLDGQHRLMAIAQAGRTVKLLVTRDLPEDVFRVVDAGKSRSIADRLKLTDSSIYVNQNACTIMRSYVTMALGRAPAPIELMEHEFLKMADEVTQVSERFVPRVRAITTGAVGAAIANYMRFHPRKASAFLEGLLSGIDLEAGSAVLRLREMLLATKIPQGRSEAYWKVIRATQHFHVGETPIRLDSAIKDWAGNAPTAMVQRMSASRARAAETRRQARSAEPKDS